MTRLYLRVFLTFWCITAVIIVTTNVIVHWRDINPDNNLQRLRDDRGTEPAQRFLFQMVGSAINRNSAQVLADMRTMPEWSTRFFYIVDSNNRDFLGRPLPEGVQKLVPKINPSHPFENTIIGEEKTWGRHVTLNDGKSVKIFTLAAGKGEKSSGDIAWQLFINNIWPLLLTSILVSGVACFFLARHLARSLSTLQRATRSIAKGDLSVRISQRFNQRRDEIASLANDFDHMAERLEKAMAEQKRLIKDVSHELRTPLARLQIALALAQQRSQGTNDRELKRIKQAADYLNDIISDILALPVLDDDSWTLDDTMDLTALLEALHEAIARDARQKAIQLSLSNSLPEALVATRGNMLAGVFDNILRNALRYTPSGGCIRTELHDRGNHYQIKIHDTGPGVSPDQLDAIFQPFYRTDQARDRQSGGYGLGLAIAQRTIKLHGGHIEARNLPQTGLCITVTLPKIPPCTA
ncbi:HAMP domain-containing protein [Gilvimarinus agarilyticus]|uniref:ATP-binding protein n=1 Tax=Gilvimarinus sp. 2_MG-2023 TaxID=3062666 RepID=UPI001C09C4E7|nr:ATP-binding protein [Gilvimarinus sp. 2_MG-2023]MBU2885110.1 HAMP domain-containing protein [Gilvimarinus agarilyticus]MDO6570008.1 ATP-binding protein [Gilvimarinus sp. 2_MG-2023]